VLKSRRVDLVVTDLQMPEVDGFQLIAAMGRSHPSVPILVMTAFGTPEIDARLRSLGLDHHLEKPLDFRLLAERVQQTLAAAASGRVSGITLPSFLQIIQIERKSCALRITSGGREGYLSFDHGEIVDASTGTLNGEPAALEIVCWEDAQIEIQSKPQTLRRTIRSSLPAILMEGFRLKDEKQRGHAPAPAAPPAPAAKEIPPAPGKKENDDMATTKEKLQELANIDGFAGAGVFTPAGEDLALLPGSVSNIKDVGVLANNVLMNAQKACLEMGAGRGQVVHVEGEKSHILVRCMNEGTDPLKSQPGRAHIHTVLVLKPEASIGMAKMRLGQVVDKLAEDFR
jgi:hypothetical protein